MNADLTKSCNEEIRGEEEFSSDYPGSKGERFGQRGRDISLPHPVCPGRRSSTLQPVDLGEVP